MPTHTIDDAIGAANASQKPAVIFIHGLWLKPNSWDRWAEMFNAAGYAALAPGWPAEVGGAAAPETIGEVAAHFSRLSEALDRRPALVGHALGGLIAQTLAGRGLSAATVAIDPAPFRGGLPLPVSALRSAWPMPQTPASSGQRGPLLIISGERDHTLPPSVGRAAYERQERNQDAVTEFVQLPWRGHALTIGSGWREVAEAALNFVRRFL
ncbi:alpha/beta fold hydrolase [Bradyrhizobium ontarionense]|uniref:Alpha/beta fold hydrolase n=1 Tax=Bradyrhizobium ontarionense TaxID=2898149 RepID=A0ABY3R6P9_9BRAD|nr:alpha/beta hydrolase [Bradyrhizobium sp. A19]UFZ03010.1 alpha/beta fold hydrolase [Bradyrhizobium sp. A19]